MCVLRMVQHMTLLPFSTLHLVRSTVWTELISSQVSCQKSPSKIQNCPTTSLLAQHNIGIVHSSYTTAPIYYLLSIKIFCLQHHWQISTAIALTGKKERYLTMSVEVFKVTAGSPNTALGLLWVTAALWRPTGAERLPPALPHPQEEFRAHIPRKTFSLREKSHIVTWEHFWYVWETGEVQSALIFSFLLSCDGFKPGNEDVPLKRWRKISSVSNSGSKCCPWDPFVAPNPFLRAVPETDGAHGSACWSCWPCEDGQSTDSG